MRPGTRVEGGAGDLREDRVDVSAVHPDGRAGGGGREGELRYTTRLAISSGSISRWSSDCGRCSRMKTRCASSQGRSRSTSWYTKSSTPAVWVGPAMTQFTVTPLPAASFAKPRPTPSRAVLETP